MLHEVKKVKQLRTFTPQKWQTVLLRNYSLVPTATLASVLGTSVETIELEAKRLGIEKLKYNPKWKEQGYINIIKNNWHLVPYDQLLELLDMDEETLAYNLKEDDFLGVKLGDFKAYAESVKYAPLTKEEMSTTERLANVVKAEFIDNYAEPFNFYQKAPKVQTSNVHEEKKSFEKIVYSYSMPYGDTFMAGEEIVSDDFLKTLNSVGVNGLWMQALLSKLSPYPFVAGLDKDYQIRRENLNKIIKKCKKYGIGVYLYLNEPRGLADNQLTPETEKLKGRFFQGVWSLCSETKEVKEYLYNAVKDLVSAVPELAGIITITMSENMTNCHSRKDNPCPICGQMKRQEVVPAVNNIIQRAVTDSGAKTQVIANLWGWTESYGWTPEAVQEGIANMDEKIRVLSVSELGHITINGARIVVSEYSLSKVGPCEETIANLAYAKKLGHKVMAKVQVNNSWEFATVPYLPVFDLIIEHMQNLERLDIDGIMMSWTLGGYPTVSFDLVNKIFGGEFDYDEWLKWHFEENSKSVKDAVKLFSDGFRSYPYSITSLYHGMQQVGSANLMYPEPTGYKATMVTFPYDNYKLWCGNYSPENYLNLLGKLLEKWEQGLNLLNEIKGNPLFEELKNFAEVVYVSLKSMSVHIQFNIERESDSKETLIKLIKEEKELTKRLYRLASKDARIGYEASNHYYYTHNNFLEKFINLECLLIEYGEN